MNDIAITFTFSSVVYSFSSDQPRVFFPCSVDCFLAPISIHQVRRKEDKRCKLLMLMFNQSNKHHRPHQRKEYLQISLYLLTAPFLQLIRFFYRFDVSENDRWSCHFGYGNCCGNHCRPSHIGYIEQ